MISDPQYVRIQDRLVVMANFVREMDLPAFVSRIEITKKSAEFLDPAIYVELDDYEAIRDVARAANDFKNRLTEIRTDWKRRRARRFLKGEHAA